MFHIIANPFILFFGFGVEVIFVGCNTFLYALMVLFVPRTLTGGDCGVVFFTWFVGFWVLLILWNVEKVNKTGFLQLRALQHDAQNMSSVLDCANAPIFKLDRKGFILSWNKVASFVPRFKQLVVSETLCPHPCSCE